MFEPGNCRQYTCPYYGVTWSSGGLGGNFPPDQTGAARCISSPSGAWGDEGKRGIQLWGEGQSQRAIPTDRLSIIASGAHLEGRLFRKQGSRPSVFKKDTGGLGGALGRTREGARLPDLGVNSGKPSPSGEGKSTMPTGRF